MYVVSVAASAWEVNFRFPWYFLSLDLFLYTYGDFLNFPYIWLLLSMCVCLCVCVLSRFSHVWLFVTPRAVADQAPLSIGFSRQEYWSGLPFPSLGYLPDPGTEHLSPASPMLQADSLPTEPPEKLLSILVLKCMVPKRWKREKWREKETDARDFPGGPLVRTLCLHCRGHSFHLWSGN